MKPITVPVVMCNWQRTERLPTILQQLSEQRDVRIHLYIWNNNPNDTALVDTLTSSQSSNLDVEIHHSTKNIGGFGRFYYARELADKYPFIVFIDDDQELHSDTILTLAKEYEPHTIKGQHAFNFAGRSNYWLRLPARRGKRATYVGTCGMVVDSTIFTDKRLFDCPKEYWFIEDLWLCYIAEYCLGWRLFRSRAQMEFVIDTKNQFTNLMPKKSQFLRHLTSSGWQVDGRLWG